MTIIYLVGPSGSGKSALCKKLVALDLRFVHFSLDEEVKQRRPDFDLQRDGWHIRWNVCREALDELDMNAVTDRVYLVDSGAGALSKQYGREYFMERFAHTICLNGDPQIIYRRNVEKFERRGITPRPFEDFYRDEYSSQRLEVYNSASRTIDTTAGNEADTLTALSTGIDAILANSGQDNK